MMVKVLSTALILCIWGATLSAQEAQFFAPLTSRPTIWYTVLMQSPQTCQCLKTKPPPQKQGPVLSLDIPIASSWDTVGEDRIQNHTIQQGNLMPLWVKTARSEGWPLPRIVFATRNLRVKAEGGVMKVLTPSPRTMTQADITIERSVWFVLVGAGRFFGQEQAPRITKGVNFEADFRRHSFGRQGWLGLKFGNFNKNFTAIRYGRGYARTEGSTHFDIPSIGDLDWFPLYFEEFKTESFSVEGKFKIKLISQSLRLDRVGYKRVIPSPDPLRFGENRFEDVWLRTETEVVPFPKVNFLRGVVVLTKDFRDKNRLMFFNDYSAVRVLLRLAF